MTRFTDSPLERLMQQKPLNDRKVKRGSHADETENKSALTDNMADSPLDSSLLGNFQRRLTVKIAEMAQS